MKYHMYDTAQFRSLKEQHNIMCLVGNGFDIQVLKSLNVDQTTSYGDFSKWLDTNNEIDSKNLLYQNMKIEKERGNELWSDFEMGLLSLCSDTKKTSSASFFKNLENSLSEIQTLFATYLNEMITPTLLSKIGDSSSSKRLAVNTLRKFLGDLDSEEYKGMKFPLTTHHYDLHYWTVFNFNFTSIFDNFIYLDKKQFSPHPYKHADRNFSFYPNPNSYKYSDSDFLGNSDTI